MEGHDHKRIILLLVERRDSETLFQIKKIVSEKSSLIRGREE